MGQLITGNLLTALEKFPEELHYSLAGEIERKVKEVLWNKSMEEEVQKFVAEASAIVRKDENKKKGQFRPNNEIETETNVLFKKQFGPKLDSVIRDIPRRAQRKLWMEVAAGRATVTQIASPPAIRSPEQKNNTREVR